MLMATSSLWCSADPSPPILLWGPTDSPEVPLSPGRQLQATLPCNSSGLWETPQTCWWGRGCQRTYTKNSSERIFLSNLCYFFWPLNLLMINEWLEHQFSGSSLHVLLWWPASHCKKWKKLALVLSWNYHRKGLFHHPFITTKIMLTVVVAFSYHSYKLVTITGSSHLILTIPWARLYY